MSAVRLAEFGCLAVLDQYDPSAKEKGYGDALVQLERHSNQQKLPPYLTNRYRKQLKDKVEAERNARIWAADGILGRRVPRRDTKPTEQETV